MSSVAVIGAGVLGLSVAHHLSSDFKVTVFDKEQHPAVHASGKNAGMFRQLYRSPQLSAWARRSRETWLPEIIEKAVIPGVSCVRGRDVPEHSASLFRQYEDSVICESDALIDPGSYCAALYVSCKKRGVNFKLGTEISSVAPQGSQWVLSERFVFDKIVNAAGAWAARLSSYKPEIKAYARHLFLLSGQIPPLEKYSWFWDEVDNFYARRWGAAEMLYSICDRDCADPDNYSPTGDKLAEVASSLVKTYNSEAELRRSWHCFRAYTADQLPIVGEDPVFENYYWLAAFGGFGMSTSWAASADLARIVRGENVKLDKGVSPERL